LTNQTGQYASRTYEKGDEKELVQLFNRVYGDFAGFVPRTPEFWLWCCLNRPDVEPEGILIVDYGKKIIGYGVVGKTGNVWELCYDPEYDGETIVSTILEWTINYLQDTDVYSIYLNVPANDRLFRETCLKSGFAENCPPYMFLSVLDFPQFVYAIFNSNRLKLKKCSEQFVIKLRNTPSWSEGNITVKIRNGPVSVEEGLSKESGIVIDTDISTFVSCILGTRGLLKAFLTKKLRVKPFWRTFKIMKLLRLLRLKDPWYCSRADHG
jgi:hypothetical protein